MAARNASYGVEDLRRDLRKKAPAAVYVVEGEEALLAAEAVQIIVDTALLGAAGRDFNLSSFSGDDETGRQFLAQAHSYPFLADRRVVIVRRFEKMSLRDREETAFFEYLKAPAPTTVLVLVARALDRRTTVAKEVERAATVVTCGSLKEELLPGWVRDRLKAQGLGVTDSGCKRLVELAGPSLLDLANEIAKLRARYPEAREIDAPQVEETAGRHRVEEVFAISRAFRPDDAPGFLRALGRVLETKPETEILGVAALLARHVNDLLRVRILLDRGLQPGALAKRLGKHPFYIDRLVPQANLWRRESLRLWLHNLQRADVQLKSLRLPQRWTLERVLFSSFLGQDLP